jgi:spermidine synthase
MTSVQRVTLRLAVFLSGAMLMAAEIVAFRIVGKTFGTALRETTAVIVVFLAAMSIGYWAGGRLGDRRPRPSTIAAVLLGAAVTLIAVPWLDKLLSPRIAASDISLSMHALVASTLLFSIPTLLFAMVSPIAIRLFATSASESGSTAGGISAVSTAGSIAGSLATAYFLLDWLASISRTVIAISLAATATALIVIVASAMQASGAMLRRYAIAIGVVSVLIIPIAAFVHSTSLEQTLVTPSREWNVLYAGDSAYHHILIRERNRNYRELTFGLNIQSRMFVNDPYGPGGPYTDAFHIARLMRPNLRRILLIGLGGGTGPKQLTRYYGDTTIDVVEIDPLIVELSKKFFEVRESDRLRIHVADGRTFLSRSNEKWDLILVDAYTTNRYGATIPPNLVTKEFFTEVAHHLTDGGILHFHCAFSERALFPALENTIGDVFRSTLASTGEILASNVPLLITPETLAERARHTEAARLPNLQRYIAALHTPVIPRNTLVLTDDYAPVDTLMRQ